MTPKFSSSQPYPLDEDIMKHITTLFENVAENKIRTQHQQALQQKKIRSKVY